MSLDLKTFGLRLAALGAAACSSAYAVRSPSDEGALVTVSQPLARSPYDVELIGSDGRTLETHESGGRFYVLGQAGDRYSIRVVNPTQRRVEALVSVDGLDVIDGETADFATKRGYVVPPGGDLVVDGFRMSATQVAAFRFSSVDASYAERKGKGRNVGVIGVAIFEEKVEPQMIAPEPSPSPPTSWHGSDEEARDSVGSSAGAAAPRPSSPPADPGSRIGGTGDVAKSEAAPSKEPTRRFDGDDRGGEASRPAEKKGRAGLGTEWGEERYSAVDFTSFVRASQTVPTAIAELRYNDVEGLRALGVLIQAAPDHNELYQRETADPFPAARGFATPPQ
ncbi:MAG TPA: hypothetical protein VK698_00180 [Kofleriaceae bacterium]|nr:hypothetical protein [Kofleriaceae bacterium]